MFLPETIKKCREELGISQEQLMIDLYNAGLKVSRPTLSNWENGESLPDVNALVSLAVVFKKPLKYFFAPKSN